MALRSMISRCPSSFEMGAGSGSPWVRDPARLRVVRGNPNATAAAERPQARWLQWHSPRSRCHRCCDWGVSVDRRRSGWGRRRRMSTTGSGEVPSFAVDYEAVFRAFAGPALLLTPGLVMVDANQAFLDTCGHSREELVGYSVFDVYPQDPQDPMAPGNRLRASVERVLATREPDTTALHRYDLWCPAARQDPPRSVTGAPSPRRFWAQMGRSF